MAKQEFRLFVSSTFRDLQQERDELIKKVFPRIRKECHRRGVEFTEIDLRWGITPEEARTGKVVRICLEEIDRCAPYFIGILGSRYGWRPSELDLGKDAHTLREFPWVRDFVEQDRSIIDMEFAYGAMMREPNASAFFYQRNSSTATRRLATTGDLPPDEEKRLSNLTKDLRKHRLPVRRFDTPEAFGVKVYRDLMNVIERDWPLNKTRSPLETERAAHASFAQVRTRSYVADARYEKIFKQHIEGDGPPLVITGRSGLGKSSLMAHLATTLAAERPTTFLIQHFIGASYTTDSTQIIRHILSEIKDRYQLADEIPSDDHKLREELPLWLAKVQSEKLVIMIDALDQLTGVSAELHWLPEFIPANVRLVVSITPTAAFEALRARKWKILQLQPLNERARMQIVKTYLKQYHKALTPQQAKHIANFTPTASPLYLRTLLEELRVFGVFEELDTRIELYLGAKDEHELFQQVLERLEKDHGRPTVRAVMTSIWAARNGLSETELLAITGLPRWKLSSLLMSMEYHFMQRDGLNVFFHNYLREAVRQRYVRTQAAHRKAHALIGEYFSQQPFNDRRRDEEPWQWKHAHRHDRLRAAMLHPEMQKLFASDSREYDVIPYLREIDLKRTLAEAVDQVIATNADSYERTLVLSKLLTAASEHALNRKLLEHCLDHLPRGSRMKRLKMEEELGTVLALLGEYNESTRLMLLVLAARENDFGVRSSVLCTCLDGLAHNAFQLQSFGEAISYAKRALELTSPSSVIDRISRLQNLAAVENGNGASETAIALCEEALQLASKTFGQSHPVVAQADGNLGYFKFQLGKVTSAIIHFNRVLSYYELTFGERYHGSWAMINGIAISLIQLGKADEAISYCDKGLELAKGLFGLSHANTITSGITYAYCLVQAEKLKLAYNLYIEWLPRKRSLYGVAHPSTIRTQEQFDSLKVRIQKGEVK